MHFETRMITLKDGRACELRPTTAEYAQEMIDYLRLTAAETPFLLRYPDEVTFTPENERELLTGIYEDGQTAMMLGLVDGVLAGNCSLSPIGGMRRIRHRGSVAIAVKKAYWGLGLGTAMLSYLEELARKAGYEQLELEVVDGNDSARGLYEKLGFSVTGRHVHAMKYDHGSFRDEWIMSKEI